MAIFLNTDISQGSAATLLGGGGIFVHDFVTNVLLSLTVKELWKSVNIWWSYGQELGVLFFLTHSVVRIYVQPATRAVGNVHHVLGFIMHVFVYLRDEQSDTFVVVMHLLDTCTR